MQQFLEFRGGAGGSLIADMFLMPTPKKNLNIETLFLPQESLFLAQQFLVSCSKKNFFVAKKTG